MGIILDIKNSIRDAVYKQDNTIKFNFNEMLVTEYPYVFFYIPSYKIDKAVDSEYWRKVDLMCVIEYMKSETNNQTGLWEYEENLTNALKLISLYDTKISARNMEFKTVENVLQVTFDLSFYVKQKDMTELMLELDMTLKTI